MSQRELLAALQQEGEARIAALWQEAEMEAEALRAENAGRLEALETGMRAALEEEKEEARRPILAQAAATVQRLTLAAEERVAQRLRTLAEEHLPQLRTGPYAETFAALVAELPAAAWARVALHPDDREKGASSFPGALLRSDPAIAGGVEVETAGGEIRVVNTLDKRLERAWPELLPVLMKEVRRALDRPGTAEKR
ncbi:V-type ATP synthase subunit E [Desulfuromonas soudanensis]|uniref:V-type ATP synthase subunit E n=1 Tax=Desulfuromonas soudanensis TaxID=1603606 RepID=A0A0M4CZN6_9BACT|nr:V-type ATP synthase subunit E [Desulfuromonas soudanensis]ALC14888.1 V-type ATP synthase subunit E [Desulfuromonas soudanensis]